MKKIDMNMLGVTIFIVSTWVLNTNGQKNKENGNNIKWAIKRSPIVFGNDAFLFCNLSSTDHCCTNTLTWMKDYDVIVHYGASTNSSKYQQIKEKGGFTLVIKHFDENDINCQYTCLYGFNTYSSILRINSNDFELRPTNETVEYTISASQLVVDVNFGKVFPSPQCKSLINNRFLQCKSVANETSNGLFISSHIKVICELQLDSCSGNISVQCLVGKAIHVMKTNMLLDMPDCKKSDATLTEVVLGITLFLAIFPIAVPVIIHRIKLHLRSNSCADLEGDEMLSLLPVQKGSMCLLEIISGCFNVRYWVPSQKSKDVIKWLQVVVCDKLYKQLVATNCRINHIRNKIDLDICSSNRMRILYSRKSSYIQGILKQIFTTVVDMLLTATNIKINEARMKRSELDTLRHMYSRRYVVVLQKMTEYRFNTADNDLVLNVSNTTCEDPRLQLKERSNGNICYIGKQLLSKKEKDINLRIDFALRENEKNTLVTASNNRINLARRLLWIERDRLDSWLSICSLYDKTLVDVLRKKMDMDTGENNLLWNVANTTHKYPRLKLQENSSDGSCYIQKSLLSKKDKMINIAFFVDVKNMLATASNDRINHTRHLLWKERNRDCSCYIQKNLLSKEDEMINLAPFGDVKNMLVTASNGRLNHARHLLWKERNPTGNNGPSASRYNRIKHDRDLITAIAIFKKTNSAYWLVMASNIRINNARLKTSTTKKRMKNQ